MVSNADEIISALYQLMTAVAMSSGVERVFSSFGLVYSKLRNFFGIEKAAMLVFLFKSMTLNYFKIKE
uniref:HAT C-terminal dimerisation domain-containing protein n=1 Tax=Lepeophtheirus salmonis TaxID=72036 RepID=A0A0K2T0Z6_LEPSM